ncbi:MAG TPA: hypothetical protein VHN79_12900 [Lacunisphaera sp.]|nr:hypothetical protein [Lacunisphaera sp.]
MKSPVILSLLVFAGASLLSAQQPADRFSTTRAHIDALLNHRLKPSPLSDKPANPFQFAPTRPVGPAIPIPSQPEASILAGDDQILAYGVSRLRITGLVLRNGISHLLINSITYKEGDLIPVRAAGDTVYYIRVVRIADRDVTFSYNEAAMVVPLPN